jgi:hypothetical protein
MNMLLDTATIAETIKNAIQGALSRHSMELDDIKKEADIVQGKRDNELVTREGTLRTLAELSTQNAWTAQQVDKGAALVAEANNGAKLPASVKTFANELRVVMQPGTREAFPSIMDAALAVWADEDLAKALNGKDADMPARKAWKRRYHVVMSATQALPTRGRLLDAPDLITAYARECDPDIKADKAAKRIKAMMDELSTIALNFPEQDVKAAFDTLSKVKVETLEAARAAMLGEAGPVTRPVTAQDMREIAAVEAREPTASATEVLDGPKPIPSTTVIEPASGVVDVFAPFNGRVFQSTTPTTTLGQAA